MGSRKGFGAGKQITAFLDRNGSPGWDDGFERERVPAWSGRSFSWARCSLWMADAKEVFRLRAVINDRGR